MRRGRPLRLAAFVAGVAAAGFVGWKVAGRYRGSVGTAHPISFRGRAARTSMLASVGTRVGVDYAAHRARRVFADAPRREQLDDAFELRSAQHVAEALGNMKGALMKFGQMASYLDQGLPEPVRATLAELQQNAPPMSADLAASVIEEELGAHPDLLFKEWDPSPIASASIGQVHRAITRDDRAVAVKVQYPGVAEAMASDLGNLGIVVAGLAQMFPGLDPGPLVDELRSRLVEELDYVNEADNQRSFCDAYRGHPFIHVPEVVDELSTPLVLTTELATGARWAEVVTWSQEERDLAAETIYRFAFGSLYRLRMFNGDPQPGNYLFEPGGHVTFLDFGLVKHFTDEEVGYFEQMIVAMVLRRDVGEFRRVIEQIGLLAPDTTFSDAEIEDYFGHFYEFVLKDERITVTSEYASETVRRFFDRTGPYGEIMASVNLPPSMVVIQRINLGLYALFGELEAAGPWRAIAEELWPFVDKTPSTAMGHLIAAWEPTRSAVATR